MLRADGRAPHTPRSPCLELSALHAADGSALFTAGACLLVRSVRLTGGWSDGALRGFVVCVEQSRVCASAVGPRAVPSRREHAARATLEVSWHSANEAAGTPAERVSLAASVRGALEAVFLAGLHPRTGTSVTVQARPRRPRQRQRTRSPAHPHTRTHLGRFRRRSVARGCTQRSLRSLRGRGRGAVAHDRCVRGTRLRWGRHWSLTWPSSSRMAAAACVAVTADGLLLLDPTACEESEARCVCTFAFKLLPCAGQQASEESVVLSAVRGCCTVEEYVAALNAASLHAHKGVAHALRDAVRARHGGGEEAERTHEVA